MKKTILKSIIVLIVMIGLSGCVANVIPIPNADQLKEANYGVIPANYKDKIKIHFDSILVDPYSVKYKFFEPFEAIAQFNEVDTKFTYGYMIEVLVNAKNRMGGYNGNKRYKFFYKAEDTTLYILNNALPSYRAE